MNAMRSAVARRIAFIQSLLMVFASLAIKAPSDVVNFLTEINIDGSSGLQVVMTKWLENTVHFAGFDEIRQNSIALSKIYSLHDPRVAAITVKVRTYKSALNLCHNANTQLHRET